MHCESFFYQGLIQQTPRQVTRIHVAAPGARNWARRTTQIDRESSTYPRGCHLRELQALGRYLNAISALEVVRQIVQLQPVRGWNG